MTNNSKWLEHEFFERYGFCDRIREVANNYGEYTEDVLEELMVDDGILDFVRPWQEESALHKFSSTVIDSEFDAESDGEFLIELFPDEHPVRRALPIDAALNRYGLVSPGDYFAEPAAHLTSTKRQDAYDDYWQNDVRISAPYMQLLTRLSEEAFTNLFSEHAVLKSLNQFLAEKLSWCEPEEKFLKNTEDPIYSLFSGPGTLQYQPPPAWVKEAVFYRDKGRCTICNVDLVPMSNELTEVHFDYMVPLMEGGLNDVTNLQLICSEHNSWK